MRGASVVKGLITYLLSLPLLFSKGNDTTGPASTKLNEIDPILLIQIIGYRNASLEI